MRVAVRLIKALKRLQVETAAVIEAAEQVRTEPDTGPTFSRARPFQERAEWVRAEVNQMAADGPLSRASLAKNCGVSQPHFVQWLRGRKALSMTALDRVCVELGVDLSAAERPGRAKCGKNSDANLRRWNQQAAAKAEAEEIDVRERLARRRTA